MKQTKQRILEAARKCFLQLGFSKTRLQDIAQEAGISVGNMAYHYKNQFEMIEVIYDEIQEKQENLLQEISLAPTFENLESFLYKTYYLQQEYLFFFLDTLDVIRASDSIRDNYQAHLEWKDMQLELLLCLNQARGALEWDEEWVDVRDLAILWRRSLNAWPYQRKIGNKSTRDYRAFRNNAWFVLMPFFTESAKAEFRALGKKVDSQS
jgi:AcrR family transcriptional regulator